MDSGHSSHGGHSHSSGHSHSGDHGHAHSHGHDTSHHSTSDHGHSHGHGDVASHNNISVGFGGSDHGHAHAAAVDSFTCHDAVTANQNAWNAFSTDVVNYTDNAFNGSWGNVAPIAADMGNVWATEAQVTHYCD